MNLLPSIVSIAPVIIGFLAARFLIPISIALHEVGHLLAAKACRIPVYAFTVGSGSRVFGFNFMGIPWTFNRAVSEGEIVVPRLVPISASGWNSIIFLALSGPAVNLALVIIAGIVFVFSVHPVVRTLGAAFFIANYSLLRAADGDYALAKTAKSRDLDKLKSYHKVGDGAPPLFNLG